MIYALFLAYCATVGLRDFGVFLASASQDQVRMLADTDPIAYLTRPEGVCNDTSSDTQRKSSSL